MVVIIVFIIKFSKIFGEFIVIYFYDCIKKLKISYSPDYCLAEAILKERFEAVSDLVKNEMGVELELSAHEIKASKKSSDALSKLPPEQQAYMKRIMSLFDSVEVELEEEENGQEN